MIKMGDLPNSMAYGGCSSSLGWEFHNLGILNADMSHALMMGSTTPPYLSSFDSDISTGYLQDALFEFSSKRRRLLLFSDDQTFPIQSMQSCCWKENCTESFPENFGYMSQINDIDSISDKSTINSSEGARSSFEGSLDSLSSSQSKDSLNDNIPSISDNKETLYSQLDGISTSAGGDEKKKKKLITRVVYPFAVVKPGGIEGDVTLNDINERILMPPTRPVRHPVGDFACRPLVSADGPGLSGKAVVALTRIQTQGRGTITIIRTKG